MLFTHREIEVLTALMTLKSASVAEIAKQSNRSGEQVVKILQYLQQKGLATYSSTEPVWVYLKP